MQHQRLFFLKHCLLPFVVALAVIGTQVWLNGPRLPRDDEFNYLQLARDLNRHGVYTDGPFAAPGAGIAPGRFSPPAYPVLLHLISALDNRVAVRIACHVEAGRGGDTSACPGSYASLYAVQSLMAALGAAFVFLIASTLSRSTVVAWLALGLALGTGYFSYFARSYLSENTAFLSFYAFLFFAVHSLSTGRLWAYSAAGAALALTAFSRPGYLYLMYFAVAALATLALARPSVRDKAGFTSVAMFSIAGCLTLLPWLVRNYLHFGDFALSSGYGSYVLAYRVAYNAMSWSEWWTAWLYWLPDFGDTLVETALPPEYYRHLTFGAPDGYFQSGHDLAKRLDRLAAAPQAQMTYLLQTYVWNDPLKHLMVTLPLVWRGIWPGKYLALAGFVLMWPAARALYRDARLLPYLGLVLPLFFMAGLHGLVSVNVVRYNVPMIALYATTVALMLTVWTDAVLKRAAVAPTKT